MSFVDFSSWPREQEQSFVVFEQHQAESKRKAIMLGGICGLAFLVFGVFIYAAIEPEKKDLSKDMNMSNLSKKGKDAPPTPDKK